jgi:hypothetical protein
VCREKKSRIEKEAKPKQEKDSENDWWWVYLANPAALGAIETATPPATWKSKSKEEGNARIINECTYNENSNGISMKIKMGNMYQQNDKDIVKGQHHGKNKSEQIAMERRKIIRN